MNGPPVTGRGLFKHYDDLRDQAEAAEEAATSAIIGGVRPEELQVCAIDLLSGIKSSNPIRDPSFSKPNIYYLPARTGGFLKDCS